MTAIVSLLLILLGLQAGAYGEDLSQASLEQLMNIRVVTLARKDETLFRSAAAVYVIRRDDIRLSGATSLPELLRMVPGIQVARIDSTKWAVTSRGFNGRFANKMLVLVDGRSVYNEIYSGVYWDMEDVFLDDVDRIEVIRGPGATMWGANAVNGVINVITRPASETQGVHASGTTGSEDRANLSLRYGGQVGSKIHYRVSSKYLNRGDTVNPDGTGVGENWNSFRIGTRVDIDATGSDTVSLLGDAFVERANQFVAPFAPTGAFSDPLQAHGGYALGKWTHRTSGGSDLTFQGYFSSERRAEFVAIGDLRVADLDFQHHIALSERNDLVWGMGYRLNWQRLEPQLTEFQVLHPITSLNLFNAFLQNDFQLVPGKLTLTAGSKFLHDSYAGFEVQPSARLLWTPNPKQSFWAAVSRAVRTPSVSDRELAFSLVVGQTGPLPVVISVSPNQDFRSENLLAYEAGYRQRFGEFLVADLAVFYNHHTDLRQPQADPSYVSPVPSPRVIFPIEWANSGVSRSQGVELSTTWNLHRNWRVNANYSFLNIGVTLARLESLGQPAVADPKHQFYLLSTVNLTRRIDWEASVQSVSALAIGVPAYTRLDTRLAWKSGETSEWSLGFNNLLDPRHLEFIAEDYARSSQIRRSIYFGWTWGR